MTDSIRVSLATEEDRYRSIFKALDYFTQDIVKIIETIPEDDHHKNYVLIKPNCICSNNPLAATNVNALRALLDFIRPIWQGRIIIAEGSGIGNTMDAFKNYHYLELKNEFPNIEFSDLNFANAIFLEVFDQDLKPMRIKISNTVAESMLRISIGPPKTHDTTIVTASIKNMAVGSILKEDKWSIHQGYKAINHSIARLYEYTYPHLAVIDGWESMEGNGPVNGKKVKSHFAVASMNALAADTYVSQIMGFNPLQIGYLNILGAGQIMPKIEIVGRNPEGFQFHFKPHQDYLKQIQWE